MSLDTKGEVDEKALIAEERAAAAEKRKTPAFQKRMKESFELHDKKGTKTIVTAELGSALRSVGKRVTTAHVAAIAKKAEAEVAGKIAFDDFVRYVELASEMEKTDRDVATAFKVFSESGRAGGHSDGKTVDLSTLRTALTTLGDKLTKQQVDGFLTECGFRAGENGQITIEQFMKVINSTNLV